MCCICSPSLRRFNASRYCVNISATDVRFSAAKTFAKFSKIRIQAYIDTCFGHSVASSCFVPNIHTNRIIGKTQYKQETGQNFIPQRSSATGLQRTRSARRKFPRGAWERGGIHNNEYPIWNKEYPMLKFSFYIRYSITHKSALSSHQAERGRTISFWIRGFRSFQWS